MKLKCACPPRRSCYDEGCKGCTGAEPEPVALMSEEQIRELLKKAIKNISDSDNPSYFIGYRRALLEVLGEDLGHPEYYPHEYQLIGTCHLCKKPIYKGDETETFTIDGDPTKVHWCCMRRLEKQQEEAFNESS